MNNIFHEYGRTNVVRFKIGNIAFIVESNRIIREVKILRYSGGLYLIRFTDSGGAIRVKEHRLFDTEAEAKDSLQEKDSRIRRLR